MSKLVTNQISPRSGDKITINGSISVGGTVTYEDVSNIDSVGIITAREGISIGAGKSVGSSSGIVTYYGDGSNLTGIANSSYTLGANGTSGYFISGPGLTGLENDPTLYLTRGQIYKFVNGMGAHPFRIQSDPNGSTGTQYNDGITNNDVSDGTLTWDVQFDAPDTLYYQCTAHAAMGGIIYIGDQARGLPNVAKTSAYSLIPSDKGKLINMTNNATVTVTPTGFVAGDIITVYNNSGTNMSIAPDAGVTLRKAGTASSGTCTLAQRGTASILCVEDDPNSAIVFVVSGNIS